MLLLTHTVLILSIGFVGRALSSSFVVNINTGGPYSIDVSNVTWLYSGDTEFRHDGKTYSTSDGSLKMLNSSSTSGHDKFGLWQSTNFSYQAGSLMVMTSIKTYSSDSKLSLAIFTQHYQGNAVKTSASDSNLVISKYPSFKLEAPMEDVGYMSYAGGMTGWSELKYGRFQQSTKLSLGIGGGPLVLFDQHANAMVISPLSQFMAASSSIDAGKQINWGIMGMVDNVPLDYTVDFIVYFSDRGINEAMWGWGEYLKKLYNKEAVVRENDPTIQYLGYWTDNGAYYYYNTEKGKNYEQTILDTDAYIIEENLPFRYLQFDSWWYTKGHKGGVKTWAPRTDIFPDGFNYIYQKTKLPIGCHNRYWDSDTTYAKANGGKYNFIIDKDTGYAVPDDPSFWPDLLNQTRGWGQFLLYEQDWLDDETDRNAALLNDLYLGRRWLMDMGSAASSLDITVQYCMAYSRHILQSLEIPAVTQARVSTDYQPGGDNWRIGVSSIFADAVEIAPYKDTFWTMKSQPGSPYKGKTEPAPALNHALATLSTGPVGPGDGIGYINTTLLMRCCDSSGLILKPSKAITAIDDQIRRAAYGNYVGPDGELYTTYSNISNYIFGIALAADMKNDYFLTPTSGWSHVQIHHPGFVYSASDPYGVPMPFEDSAPVRVGSECTKTDFCLYHTTPLFIMDQGAYNIVMMGEPDKWVPFSNQRFSQINQTTDDIYVTLRVQAGEGVIFNFWVVGDTSVTTVYCDNSKGKNPVEEAVISIAYRSCTLH